MYLVTEYYGWSRARAEYADGLTWYCSYCTQRKGRKMLILEKEESSDSQTQTAGEFSGLLNFYCWDQLNSSTRGVTSLLGENGVQ